MLLEGLLLLVVFSNPDLTIPPTSLVSDEEYKTILPGIAPKITSAESSPIDEGNIPPQASSSPFTLINKALAVDNPFGLPPDSEVFTSCVRTARLFNQNIPLKDARDIIPNSEPVINGAIQFYYPKTDTWHIAIILEFRKDGFWVGEGNFKKNEYGERLVSYNDTFVRGFLK